MAKVYKCPNCFSALTFDIEKKKLGCEFCGSEFDISMAEELETIQNSSEYVSVVENENGDMVTAEDGLTDSAKMSIYTHICPNCGAAMMGDRDTAATFCSFCGNPTLNEAVLTETVRPKRIIPFTQTKEQAQKSFVEWAQKGLLTPSDFTSSSTVEKMTGIYVPFWLYDCDTLCDFKGTATKNSYKHRRKREVIITKVYSVTRKVRDSYREIPADASEKMDDKKMDLLEPFDLQKLEPFRMAYLSGFLAEKNSFDSEQLKPRVKERMQEYATQSAKDTVKGYTSVTKDKSNVDVTFKKSEYVMLPVWFLHYDYHGKQYDVAMNGQTGRVVGERPVSETKELIAGAIAFAGIGLIALLLGLILVPLFRLLVAPVLALLIGAIGAFLVVHFLVKKQSTQAVVNKKDYQTHQTDILAQNDKFVREFENSIRHK